MTVQVIRIGCNLEWHNGHPVVVDVRHFCLKDEHGECTDACRTEEIALPVGEYIAMESLRVFIYRPNEQVNLRMLEMFVPPLPEDVFKSIRTMIYSQLHTPASFDPNMN